VRKLIIILIIITLSGCNVVHKDYVRPSTGFVPEGFKLATPSNISLEDKWWQFFNDQNLNQLIEQLFADNLTLATANARFESSKALMQSTYSSFWPNFNLGTSAGKSSNGNNRKLELSASWQLDLWGSVRSQLASDKANLQANLYDISAAKLALSADLIHNYLQIAMLDAQIRLLTNTVKAYQISHKIVSNKYQAGIAPKSDLTQAVTQLKNAQLQVISLQYQRVLHENAIAVLIGKPPSNFQLDEVQNLPSFLQIPNALPSDLLERRPDIASSEQKIIAANAAIGVAKAAYFPNFSFNANSGYVGSNFTNLLNSNHRAWSAGYSVTFGIFDFGYKKAQVLRAKAIYEQMISDYRQTVLVAVREVEDALAAIKFLNLQIVIQTEALAASKESLHLMNNQYQAGKVDYQSVINLQASALSYENSLIALQTNILRANVQLITALGGGFNQD